MAAPLSAFEKGLTPFGMLAVDWDQCKKVSPLYCSTKQKFFVLTRGFFIPYFQKDLYTYHHWNQRHSLLYKGDKYINAMAKNKGADSIELYEF
jgi:hypothetical protein